MGKTISLDSECILIETSGNSKLAGSEPSEPSQTVFCQKVPISQSEFNAAGESGIKSEVELIVSTYDYSGQKKVEFEDQTYEVYRNYPRDDEYTELYLKVK